MAAAASILLTTGGHENKVYEISGEVAYSFSDIANILSELSGKSVSYHAPSVEQFTQQLKSMNLPDQAIMGMSTFCQAIAQGEFNFPDTTLKNILGRNPESVKDYLKVAYNL